MSRDKLLGEARAALTQLPDLYAELARTLTERNHDVSGYQKKVVGSPAPLRLPILHLADLRHKPEWDGVDPRVQKIGDRYGIVPTLELWVKVIWEETDLLELTETPTVRSECAVLLEYWSHVEQADWATRLADDISKITATVRAHLGIRPEYRPRCRWCPVDPVTKQRPLVDPVEANTHNLTTWEACAFGLCRTCGRTYPKGAALDALAHVQPPMPLSDIAAMIGIPVKTLHRWHVEGLIQPETTGQKRNRLFDLAAVREVAAKVRSA